MWHLMITTLPVVIWRTWEVYENEPTIMWIQFLTVLKYVNNKKSYTCVLLTSGFEFFP